MVTAVVLLNVSRDKVNAIAEALAEMEGISEADAREAFRLAASKLPIPTRFVKRR